MVRPGNDNSKGLKLATLSPSERVPGAGPRLFHAVLKNGTQEVRIPSLKAADVLSFGRFRQAVLAHCGAVLRCEQAELPGTRGKKAWLTLVEQALDAGA